jgi:tRNA (guanosine-2'-O-)-methyltransferase
MVSDRRDDRMRQVLERRLGRVRCAVEAVYHRHNVSAILRSCDAFGIHHVHVVGGEGGATGPARGAERWLAIHPHATAAEALAALREAGCDVWVADLADGPTVVPERVPLDRPVCLWFGAELLGVSAEARAAARGVVTVPMAGMAQSLNVSVAAAVVLRPVADRARALGAGALLPEAERAATLAAWRARDDATVAAIHAFDEP